MQYKCNSGEMYNLSVLDPEESEIFGKMIQEYGSGQTNSWIQFHLRWEERVVEMANSRATTLERYVLKKIEHDLARNIGIQRGELQGTISDMLIDDSTG